MSGTGATVFGLFAQRSQAQRAYEELGASYRDTFLTRNV